MKTKTQLKNEKTQPNGKTSFVNGSKELVLRSPYYPKPSRFNPISIKIPMAFFTEIEKQS